MSESVNFYQELNNLREQYPELTFNNDGYENIPDAVRARNKQGHDNIEALLKKSVQGFVRFQNFKPRKDGSIAVRCQMYCDQKFVGVTYIPLEDFKPENIEIELSSI